MQIEQMAKEVLASYAHRRESVHGTCMHLGAMWNHAPALAAFALAALKRLSDADLDAVMAELGGER